MCDREFTITASNISLTILDFFVKPINFITKINVSVFTRLYSTCHHKDWSVPNAKKCPF
ncbi:hypothetical protein KPSB59_1690015 [Klebsiella quasipneumoniae subsp. quasipneumoniae]|nr:hypothetical protein KPSB59_1690015 [Klebsiella quasipneumoniae subsp. quasipneumoniae]